MSSELQFIGTATGNTIYAVIIAANSTRANNTSETMEALTVANWTEYAVSLTETPASSYFYAGSFPLWITTAGDYFWIPYKQLGGSPAITDDILVGKPGIIVWNGTAEVQVGTTIDWLKNVKEGDNSFDISNPAQFQSVVKIKDTETDLIRKNLEEADGTPIVDLNTVIGKQVEP